MEIALTGVCYFENGDIWWPEELVTREQALTALTINCAKQMFIEDERGSIKEGKYADFLLVNKDILTCPVTEIHTARPESTYFEGKKVFSLENTEEKKAPDYSKKASWYKIPEITKDVDTFYINSTVYFMDSLKEDAPEYATLDNEEMLNGFEEEYMSHATVYEESTNVFMPYYRQAGMRVMKKSWQETGDVDAAISGMPYNDLTAALDYYFQNCNEGRPFIIAGHSQGSALVRLLLKKYFKEHPDYYKRMIAAYAIGYSITKDDLKEYPHLKFATGESDTGVIISWNTEGKKNVEENFKTAVLLPNAISINPLNWKLDETYAPASENLGSLVENPETGENEIVDIGADAQVNLARGVIVTNGPADPMTEEVAKISAEYFGPDGRHDNDYTLFYNNIKNNVAKRVAAYKKNMASE